jgi:Domain of unknown function (DUF1844)
LREETHEEQGTAKTPAPPPVQAAPATPEPATQPAANAGSPLIADDSAASDAAATDSEIPPPPSSAEQEAQAAAYRQSSKALDSQVELNGHSAKEFEMTFERFLASLYMTAMLQLGLMRQQNEQPRIDIIGARQTIDTLSLISEKTKNNLTPVEENFLQNSLYELRMAYVEVTNALSRPPQPGPATGTGGR